MIESTVKVKHGGVRRLLAAAALLFVAFAVTLNTVAPTAAWAEAPSDEQIADQEKAFEEKYAGKSYKAAIKDRKVKKSATSDSSWTDDNKMIGACGEYPEFDAVNWGPFFTYSLYSLAENAAGFCVDCGSAMLQAIKSSDLLKLQFTGYGSDFTNVYTAVSLISVDVIQPVCIGFLGLACVWALLEFSKEVATNKGDHFSMAGNYVWIIVKFSLVMVLISHTVTLCGGVYDIFLWVANKVSETASSAGLSSPSFNSFMLHMMEVRYNELGRAFGFAGVSLVVLVSCGLCLIKVMVLVITRMFEIYIMTAFAGIPIVMVTTRETRPSGIGYFKKFAGVCLQAAVLVAIIAFGGVCFSVASGILNATPPAGINSGIWSVVTLLASIAGCIAFSTLCSQSKQIANTIMGAMG